MGVAVVWREGTRVLPTLVVKLWLFLLVCHSCNHVTAVVTEASIARLCTGLTVVHLRSGRAHVAHLLAHSLVSWRLATRLRLKRHVTGHESLHVGREIFKLNAHF